MTYEVYDTLNDHAWNTFNSYPEAVAYLQTLAEELICQGYQLESVASADNLAAYRTTNGRVIAIEIDRSEDSQ